MMQNSEATPLSTQNTHVTENSFYKTECVCGCHFNHEYNSKLLPANRQIKVLTAATLVVEAGEPPGGGVLSFFLHT